MMPVRREFRIVTEIDSEFVVAEVARLWIVWSGESQTLASSATTGKRRYYSCTVVLDACPLETRKWQVGTRSADDFVQQPSSEPMPIQ